jgi:murein DD-endopeptidase MepM/ murein hydrolase activator NlpD
MKMALSRDINFTDSKPIKKFDFLRSLPLVVANSSLLLFLFVPQVHGVIEGGYNLAQLVTRVQAWVIPQELPTLDKDQSLVVAEIIRAGQDMKMSDRDIQIGVMTALQESGARNLHHGDDWFFAQTGGGKSDSVGVFQQRNMTPWNKRDRMNPYQASLTFFEELQKVNDRNTLEPWQVAARVQKPAKQFERHYEQWQKDSEVIVSEKLDRKFDLMALIPGNVPKDEKWIKPIPGAEITSPYGMRLHPIQKVMKPHTGIDFAATYGQPTIAARSGTITSSGDKNDGYGTTVEIDHGDGYTSLYAHLSQALVSPGQKVDQGTTIGLAGSTGQSTGVHSHFEIRKDGNLIDPATLLQ